MASLRVRSLLAVAALAVTTLLGLPAPPAAAASMSLPTNSPPGEPSNLSLDGDGCLAEPRYIRTATPQLWATVDDPDESGNPFERLTATFAYWPADRPAERVEWTSSDVGSGTTLRYQVPTELARDVTYAFTVRATDRAGAVSNWSPECRFIVDTVRPKAPSISSTDYPTEGWPGGPGIPGAFTFKVAAGDTDVTRFRWSVAGLWETTPVGPDGTATVQYTPAHDGVLTMSLMAYDRALNSSDTASYTFRVKNTAPDVEDRNPDGGLSEPRTIVLSPGMTDVTEYTYWLNEGPHTTVAADADGVATIVVTPDLVGDNYLHVTSRTATGLPSGQTDFRIRPPTAPTLTSPDFPTGNEAPLVGEQVTLTFHPGMAGVAEYVWKVNRNRQQVTPAGPDGTVTVTWTERDKDYLSIEVFTRTTEGLESEPRSYQFSLTSHAPAVESAEYPVWSESGGPGVAGTFTFRPARDGVTSYTWRLDDGPEQTIPAAADGTATMTWTPTADQTGWHVLKVSEHLGEITSNPTEYEFGVAEQAPQNTPRATA